MKVSKFTFVFFVFLFSCSSRASSSNSQTALEPKVQKVEEKSLPSIDGKPISDLPIADPNLEKAWTAGQRLLHPQPPVLAEAANAEDSALWLSSFLDWARLFFVQRHALIKDFGRLQGSDRVTLFSNLLFANIDARFIKQLQGIKLPSTLSERSSTYIRNTIDLKISVLMEATISEFRAAERGLQNAHDSLDVWKAICEKEYLLFSEQRANYDKTSLQKKTKYKQSLTDKWPTECQTKGVSAYEKYAGRGNITSKPQRIALLVDEDDFKDIFKDNRDAYSTFRKTLQKTLRKQTKKAKLIPLKEIDLALKLVSEKKLSKNSKSCSVAPPVEAVLQRRYKNLIIAKVTKTHILDQCSFWDEKKNKMVRKDGCAQNGAFELTVRISAYGTQKNFATIQRQANVKVQEKMLPESWIAAALALDDKSKSKAGLSIFGSLTGGIGLLGNKATISKRFYDKGYQDPWFEKTKTLNDNKAFRACNNSSTPMSYDLTWSISPEGQSQDVKFTWVRAPKDGADRIQVCMEKTLGETSWRCPSSGKVTTLSSRVCEKKSYKWWDMTN